MMTLGASKDTEVTLGSQDNNYRASKVLTSRDK
jgi:hypothetical protein